MIEQLFELLHAVAVHQRGTQVARVALVQCDFQDRLAIIEGNVKSCVRMFGKPGQLPELIAFPASEDLI